MNIRNNSNTTLDLYLLDNKPIILIIPGGGYDHTSVRESKPVADKFNSLGYSAAVLNYRNSLDVHPSPMIDLAYAIKYLKNFSKEIILCGFSAGGHLVGSFLCHYGEKFILDDLKCTKDDIRINYAIFCYPVITSGNYGHKSSFKYLTNNSSNKDLLNYLSVEKNITEDYPECFIWTTFTDNSVPMENTLLLMQALREKSINFEAHIFPYGNHGLSLATKETARNDSEIIPYISKWINLLEDWLKYKLGGKKDE